MGNIQTVGPNEALIVSGGCCRPSRKQIIVGGWCWSTWMLTNIQRISLQVMTLNPKCDHVQSEQGVPVSITGVVHCKINSAQEFLPLAAEQLLGKSIDQIKSVILHTVEGHMRAIVGTQRIEDICKKRQELASLIREAATKDLQRMGIDVMSLTIKEIKDDVEYLSSAGKKSTALIKKDAAVAVAKAEGSAAQKEAECERTKKELEVQNDANLAEKKHSMEMQRAGINEKVSRMNAEAAKAYDLQLASMHKDIREIEMAVKDFEFDETIKIQEKEIERQKTELEMEVELPTRSEIYELTKQTEANEAKLNSEATAEEVRIREEGNAQAEAAKLVGQAEAEGMGLVAMARKQFNEAAVLAETLKVLPDIAAEIASPLTKFEEILLISDKENYTRNASSGATDKKGLASKPIPELAKLVGSVPPTLKALGRDEKMSGSLINSIMRLQRSET